MKNSFGLIPQLPVVDITAQALSLIWQKRRVVVPMFFPLLVLLVVVDAIAQYLLADMAIDQQTPQVTLDFISQLVFLFLSAMLSVLLATSSHRFTLLPEVQWHRNALHGFGKNEWRYLLRGIQIGIISAVAMMLVMLPLLVVLGQEQIAVALVAGVLAMLYIWARLSSTLPRIALGEQSSLSSAWQFSKGNGSRLVLVVFIIPVLMLSPCWWLISIDGGEDSIAGLRYLASFGVYLTTLVSLVMLSLSYQFISDFETSGPETSTAAPVADSDEKARESSDSASDSLSQTSEAASETERDQANPQAEKKQPRKDDDQSGSFDA